MKDYNKMEAVNIQQEKMFYSRYKTKPQQTRTRNGKMVANNARDHK
jgi:hypothetical protein